jgi:hypothetical protein
VLDYLNGEGHKVLRVHKHWQSLSDSQKETALSNSTARVTCRS